MKLLLFAGAGTSVELGVPGMVGIGAAFVDHARQWNVEPAVVEKLLGDPADIEHLIEALDHVCTARPAIDAFGHGCASLDRADKIRAEVEWFLQHVAERVAAGDASLMWGSVLRAAASTELTLVTTNYDRAIELAANATGVAIDDGFESFGDEEIASWTGFGQHGARPQLVKLHGSTDWYAAGDAGAPTKLRHPMPLFGRAALRLADGMDLGSALVLPSREKLLTHDPYPRLSQAFLNAADCCDAAIFVGSSLRDSHIRGAVASTARRVPVFVVNPSGAIYGVANVTPISQYASTFLISTLPQALLTRNPPAALLEVAGMTTDDGGTLAPLRVALDSNADTSSRCRALERLDTSGIILDPTFLRALLADEDPTVARYTFGLVFLSPDCHRLTEEAKATHHAGDPAFHQDLELLHEMLASKA